MFCKILNVSFASREFLLKFKVRKTQNITVQLLRRNLTVKFHNRKQNQISILRSTKENEKLLVNTSESGVILQCFIEEREIGFSVRVIVTGSKKQGLIREIGFPLYVELKLRIYSFRKLFKLSLIISRRLNNNRTITCSFPIPKC